MAALVVDTAIWIDHLRRPEPRLVRAMRERRARVHRFVLAEVALGSLKDRTATMRGLDRLERATEARHEEVMGLIERERLYGTGIGYVDAHLLASTLLTPGATLWTLDRRLGEAAERLGMAATPDG